MKLLKSNPTTRRRKRIYKPLDEPVFVVVRDGRRCWPHDYRTKKEAWDEVRRLRRVLVEWKDPRPNKVWVVITKKPYTIR